MTNPQQHQPRRLSIDLTPQQHTWLKTEAARHGISMREFAIEKIGVPKELSPIETMDEETFSKELKKSLRRNKKMLANLAKR